jgi:parallel beta-helix repeat protein
MQMSGLNTLDNNTCSNNLGEGVYLFDYSDNNTFTNNTFKNNGWSIGGSGIGIGCSFNNTIHHNYLLNNQTQAYDDGTNNWDNGSEGNYWDDWQPPEHPDADGNGIVDEPRPIEGGSSVDRYPLVIGAPYNTPTGTSVEVVAADPDTGEPTNVTITFENVTAAGNTTAKKVEGAPPAGYELVPENIYYDITTTAEYTGTITVAIYYGGLGVLPEQESGLQLKKLVGSEWVDITTLVDTENKIIYGATNSLSLFAVMFKLPRATVDIVPDVLNLKSKGKWITCYIELSDGYDVADIDINTVMLEGVVPAELHPTKIGDYDRDGIPDLMVKFDRAAVQKLLEPGEVKLTVTGKVGTLDFEGSDTIRVIAPGKKG